MYIDEKDVETALIDKLKEHSLKAHHMDVSVDGFPDIFVAGKKVVLVEVKYDRSASGKLLCEIMEPDQPVFHHDMNKAGFHHCYLAVCHNQKLNLYCTEDILFASMAGKKADTGLKCLVKNGTVESVAQAIERITNG